VSRTGAINVVTAVITAQRKKPMKYFTIDNDNDIRAHASAQEADAVANAERFSTAAGLTKLAEKWPTARLVEVWNSLPGVSEVKKFKDRATAATRIWKAVQSLGETPAPKLEAVVTATELTPEVVEAAIPAEFQPQPEAAAEPASEPELPIASVEPATEVSVEPAAELPVSPAPTAEPVANAGAQGADVPTTTPAATRKSTSNKKAPTGETGAPREGSKTSQVIAMLKREGGTTLEEIMAEMGWLKHTTRAMLSAGGSLTKKHGLVVTSEKVGDKRIYRIKA
jgi:hypothetical protein